MDKDCIHPCILVKLDHSMERRVNQFKLLRNKRLFFLYQRQMRRVGFQTNRVDFLSQLFNIFSRIDRFGIEKSNQSYLFDDIVYGSIHIIKILF